MIVYCTAIFMFLAGILHCIAAPDRGASHIIFGIFFIALGVVQILYACALIRTPTRKLLLFGIVFNTGLLVLWLLTQTLPHLAGSSREPLTILSGARKLLELISVELLLIDYRRTNTADTATVITP